MKKSILNTSIKACNGYGLTLNAIWIFASLVYIIWFLKKKKGFIKINAKVIDKKQLDICKVDENKFSFLNSVSGEQSHCILTIEYNTNNRTNKKEIDFNKCNDINIGDEIEILYNQEKDEIILDQYNEILKKVFYFVVVFMLIIILFTYLRIFHSDNKWMKIYISLQCFLPG